MTALWTGVIEEMLPDDATLRFGTRFATGLIGLDAYYRAESDDRDGLVVLNMGEDRAMPASFTSWADARTLFEALLAETASLATADRREYYGQACRSALAFIAWRERGLDFVDRLAAFLHVPPQPVADAAIDALCDELRNRLGQMGFHGDLGAQCDAWQERNRVDAADVPEILAELLDAAWDRTEASLLRIPAPKDDGMRVATVSGRPYNARCDYRARTIELNTDPILTRPGLHHLAVHEGYPGHYVQFKLRETLCRLGAATADVLLSVVNTASSAVFEGIADAGMMMAGSMSDDDHVQRVLNRHRAAIATRAAWELHADGRPRAAVESRLRSACLAGGEGWVANRMRFIEAPARAVLIWSYWHGEPAVARAWERIAPDRRPAFIQFLHGRMHSTRTVAMFE